jgi:hypothetical protein
MALLLHSLRIVASAASGGISRRDNSLHALTGLFERSRDRQIFGHGLGPARLDVQHSWLPDQRPDRLSLVDWSVDDHPAKHAGGPTTRIIVRSGRPWSRQHARLRDQVGDVYDVPVLRETPIAQQVDVNPMEGDALFGRGKPNHSLMWVAGS